MKALQLSGFAGEALRPVDLGRPRFLRNTLVAAGHRLAIGFALLVAAIAVGLGIASVQ